MMEYWNNGDRGYLSPPKIPLFQYSIIPLFLEALW